MAVSKNNQKKIADGRYRGRKKVRHLDKFKRFPSSAKRMIEISLDKIQSSDIKRRSIRLIQKLRLITSAENVKKACTDQDSRIRSGTAVGTAFLMSLFTGSVFVGVTQAAVSSVVASAISSAKSEDSKKKSAQMDAAVKAAKNQYSSSNDCGGRTFNISSPRRKY
jgi:hypothetical protein